MELQEFQPYHKNPRLISIDRFEKLGDSLASLGDLGGIVVNRRTNEIIGGNQRTRNFLQERDRYIIDLSEEFEPPQTDGTVALGYVTKDKGLPTEQRFSFRVVEWDDETAERANIQANKVSGFWDYNILANNFDVDKLLSYGFTDKELFGDGMFPPIFNPNNMPQSDGSQMTAEDIAKAGQDLKDKLTVASKFIAVVCPQCGHDFQINN